MNSAKPHAATPPPPDAPVKAWAHYYRSLGLHPIPVKIEDTKKPLVDWKHYQTRQPTVREIEGWSWYGVGIVTTGLICVDCDRGGEQLLKDREFPASWTVRTGGGGLHRYYRGNDQAVRNAVRILKGENGAGVDIRAEGGFAVMPPTRHKDTGQPYQWLLPPESVPLAPAPLLDHRGYKRKRQATVYRRWPEKAGLGGGGSSRCPAGPEERYGGPAGWLLLRDEAP